MQVNSSATSQNLLEVSRRLSENQPDVAAECLKCLIKSSTQEASSLQEAYNLLLSIYKKNIQLLVIEPKDDPLSLLKFCKYVVNRQEAPLGHLLLLQIAKLWDQSMMVIPEKNQLLGPTISLYQFRLSLRFNFVDPSVQKSNLDFLKKIPPTLLTDKQRVSVNFYKELLISDFLSIESLLKQAPNPQKRALLLYKKAFLSLEYAKSLDSVIISQSYIKIAKLICDQLLCGIEINEIIKFKIQILLLTIYYEKAKKQDFSFSIEEIKGLFHQIVSSSLAHPSECTRANFHYAYILVHLDSFLLRSEGFNLMRALLKDLSSNLNENSRLTDYIKQYVNILFARTSPVELYAYGIPFKESLEAYHKNIDLEIAQYHLAELYCYGDHEVPGNPSAAKKIFNRLKRSKNNNIRSSAALKELEVTFCLMQNHQTMLKPQMLNDSDDLSTLYKIINIATDARKKNQQSTLNQIFDTTKAHLNNPSIRIYGLLTMAEFVAKETVESTNEFLDKLIADIKNELDLTNSEGPQGNTLEHTRMRAYFLLAELKRKRNSQDEALDYYRRVYQHPLCLHRHKLIATFYIAQSLAPSNPEKYIYFFLLSLKKGIFPKLIEKEIENFMKRFPLEDEPLIEQIIERLLDKDSDCLRFGLSLAFSLYQRNHHSLFEKSLLKYITVPEMHIYYQILLDRREINAALLKEISLPKLIELIIQPFIYAEEKLKCSLIMKQLIQLNFLETTKLNDLKNCIIPLDTKKNIPLFVDFLKKIYEAHSTLTSESDALLTKRIMQILLKTNSLKKIAEEDPDLISLPGENPIIPDQISLPEENPIIVEEDLQQAASAHQSFDSDRETSPHSLSFVLNSSEEETLDDFDWQNMSTIHTYSQDDCEELEPMQF